MTKLQIEAIKSCEFRGHDMSAFNKHNISECKTCKAWVQTNNKPAPNEINIGGPAVAMHCPIDSKWL